MYRFVMLAALALCLAACGFAAPTPPASLSITGAAGWSDGCPSGFMCLPQIHDVSGNSASPTIDLSCSIRAVASGGYDVSFRIAAIHEGHTFDESSEGLSVTGFLPAVGQELRTGSVAVKGLGWSISAGTVGAAGQCHVFIDTLEAARMVGRIACPAVMDDQTPPTTRIISGNQVAPFAGNESFHFGSFAFSGCDSP